MAFYNKIKPGRQSWIWPGEDIERIEVNSMTDAEGMIEINYDNITQVDSEAVTIFKVDPPLLPAFQYTKTGIDLNTGTQFDLDNFLLHRGRIKLEWKFNTVVLGVTTGDFYLVSITINSIIKIDFIIKIVDVEV